MSGALEAGVSHAAPSVPTSPTPVHADLHVVADVNDRDDDAVRLPRGQSPQLPVVLGFAVALAVAFFSNDTLAPWACAVVWAAVNAARTVAPDHARSLRTRVAADLRTGVALGFIVSVAGLLGPLSVVAARWGLVAILAATAAAVAVRVLQPRGGGAPRVVLVGTHRDIESYRRSSADVSVVGCHVVHAGPTLAVPTPAGVPTTTSMGSLGELAHSVAADLVLVLPGPEVDADTIRQATWALERSRVRIGLLTPATDVSERRLATAQVGGRTLLEVAPAGGSRLQCVAKGALDRCAAALMLPLVAPVLLLLLLAVRLDSKGPGLFVQTRVGRHGKLFRMLKLRTMYSDAEAMRQALLEDNESDGVLFKIRRDPRVTRLGYWLRRSSLDELPQLINVLLGHMSMVGPRPALPSEVAAYDDRARRRLAVKPGITGLWQVSGRSDLSWDESIRLDLHYADNWSLAHDLNIALRTISAVTRARGAY